MDFLATLIATSVVNIPVAIVLLYVLNWRRCRSIVLTILVGAVLVVILHPAQKWQDTFYLQWVCFIVHTAIAYGLIRLKKRMDASAESKY